LALGLREEDRAEECFARAAERMNRLCKVEGANILWDEQKELAVGWDMASERVSSALPSSLTYLPLKGDIASAVPQLSRRSIARQSPPTFKLTHGC